MDITFLTYHSHHIDYKKAATQLIQMLGVNDRDWRIGATKVFTRQHVQTALETAREQKLTKLVSRRIR